MGRVHLLERLFASEKFYQVLWNSIRISFLKIAIGFPGPIIFALLLNEVRQVAWKKSFQTISYLPHFVSWNCKAGSLTARRASTTSGTTTGC